MINNPNCDYIPNHILYSLKNSWCLYTMTHNYNVIISRRKSETININVYEAKKIAIVEFQ